MPKTRRNSRDFVPDYMQFDERPAAMRGKLREHNNREARRKAKLLTPRNPTDPKQPKKSGG